MHVYRFKSAPALSAVVLFGIVSASAQTGAAHFPVTAGQVAGALQKAGLGVTGLELELPGALITNLKEPVLQVTSTERSQHGRLRVRLVCRPPSECVPFLVTVALGSNDSAPILASLNSSLHGPLPIERTSAPELRIGEQTTLLMQDQQMSIAIPVVAIDNGRSGAEVRVRTLDHKKVFRAIVISSQAVQGELQ